jgi:Protein of unknown function (DUF3168)
MSDALTTLQTATVAVLQALPVSIFDGPPPRAPFPYVALGDCVVSDWSSKSWTGREIRFALNVWDDGEEPARLHALMAQVEGAVASLPQDLPGWRIASLVFIRSLIARDPDGPWLGLVEHRVRMMEV